MVSIIEVTGTGTGATDTAHAWPPGRTIPIDPAGLCAREVFAHTSERTMAVLHALDLCVEFHTLSVSIVTDGAQRTIVVGLTACASLARPHRVTKFVGIAGIVAQAKTEPRGHLTRGETHLALGQSYLPRTDSFSLTDVLNSHQKQTKEGKLSLIFQLGIYRPLQSRATAATL